MLDYQDVKRHKRELMMAENFVDGRGRIESVEFHNAEFCYLRGVADGDIVAAKLEQVIRLLQQRGPGYGNVLALVEQIRDRVRFE